MDFMEAIQSRRSVRSFSDRPVNPSTVQLLIEIANMAPSARNAQPWAFWTFMDPEGIERLGEDVKAWVYGSPKAEPFASPMRPVLDAIDSRIFYGAPVLILVLAKCDLTDAKDACCLAAENLMLAARSAGLGSAWVRIATDYFASAEVKRRLAIPEEYTVVVPLVLGYPSAGPTVPQRRAPEVRWCSVPAPGAMTHY